MNQPNVWNTSNNYSISEFKRSVYPAAYLFIFTFGLIDQDPFGRTRCLELDSSMLKTIIVLNRGVLFLGFVMPFAVISVCYIFAAFYLLKLKKARPNQKSPFNHKKSCSLVIIVLLIFLTCFMPYHVARTLFLEAEMDFTNTSYGGSCHYIQRSRQAAVITHCLASGNSCLDPILFFFVGENFINFWRQNTSRRQSCIIEQNVKVLENIQPAFL